MNIIKKTLSEQIYTILKEDIINQNIKAGEKITIKALQERFNISSTPVREAMNRLSQEGLIDHVTNVGAKVIEISIKDIKDIYDLCLILDEAALKLAINSIKKEEFISVLKTNVELQEAALAVDNIEDFKQYSDDFHDIFYKFAENDRLYKVALRIRSQLSILTNIYQNIYIAKEKVFVEHKNILNAVINNDFNESISLLNSHFETAKTYLLENLSKI